MQDVLNEVDAAQQLLQQHFASNSKVIVDRGPTMPSTDISMPVHIGVSLRQISPEEDVDGAPTPKRAGMALLFEVAENDYAEDQLYSDYVLPAVRVLEEASWDFDRSVLGVDKEGSRVKLGIRADLSKLVI